MFEIFKKKKPICNCKTVKESNIVRSKTSYSYDEIEDFLKNKFPNYNIFYSVQEVSSFWMFKSKKFPNVSDGISFEAYEYYKKACLTCGTCLDEINDLYNRIKPMINKLDSIVKNEEMIQDICGICNE